MVAVAKRIHPLLGAGTLLIPAGPAKGRIEIVQFQRLLQRLGFHDVGIDPRTVRERVDPLTDALFIGVDEQFQPQPLRLRVAKTDHVPEFPGGVDVK